MAWPLYKLYGHAFEAFKLMVADDGAALIKRLEEERGPLTVFTPQVGWRGRMTCLGSSQPASISNVLEWQPGDEDVRVAVSHYGKPRRCTQPSAVLRLAAVSGLISWCCVM